MSSTRSQFSYPFQPLLPLQSQRVDKANLKYGNEKYWTTSLFLLTLLLFTQTTLAQQATRKFSFDRNDVDPNATVLVELFTSQGCNSCPPADELLQQIKTISQKNQLPVFVLSYHVDYWNDLGWPDPYSQAAFTNRQRKYARVQDSDRIYTPQMIINGTRSFVGSDYKAAKTGIESMIRQKQPTQLILKLEHSRNNQSVNLKCRIESRRSSELKGFELLVAIVHSPEATEVKRGENANRTLKHVNVVRSLQVIQLPQEDNELKLKLPRDFAKDLERDDTSSDWRILCFLQNKRNMKIHAAQQIQLIERQENTR